MMTNTSILGVISGDLVRSRQLNGDDFQTVLATLAQTLDSYQKASLSYDIYRGDAFQVATPSPYHAVELALVIRMALKATEPFASARQSIAIGLGEANRHSPKTAMSEAYVLSGTALDQLKSQQMVFSSNDQSLNDKCQLLTRTLDTLLMSVSSKQAQALFAYLTLEDNTHQAIADHLGTSRVNATKLLNASHYQLVSDYLRHMKTMIAKERSNE